MEPLNISYKEEKADLNSQTGYNTIRVERVTKHVWDEEQFAPDVLHETVGDTLIPSVLKNAWDGSLCKLPPTYNVTMFNITDYFGGLQTQSPYPVGLPSGVEYARADGHIIWDDRMKLWEVDPGTGLSSGTQAVLLLTMSEEEEQWAEILSGINEVTRIGPRLKYTRSDNTIITPEGGPGYNSKHYYLAVMRLCSTAGVRWSGVRKFSCSRF